MLAPSITLIAFVAGLITPSTAVADCTWTSAGIYADYHITAENVPDIPGTCGGFWDNLNNRNFNGACTVFGPASCENVEGKFDAKFQVAGWCNAGHVGSAWWEATKNQYGPIDCKLET